MANRTYYTHEKRDLHAFVKHGEKADNLVWRDLRASVCIARWAADDLIVTRLAKLGGGKFAKNLLTTLLQEVRPPGVKWVDIPDWDKNNPISLEELYLLAALKGVS